MSEDKQVPWYLAPASEAERRAAPWDGTPAHLRPQFLPSEFEIAAEKLRYADHTIAPVCTSVPNSPAHWEMGFRPGGPCP